MLGPRCCSAHGCPPGAPVDKSEISELASFFGQFLEQRCRLPPGAQLLVEFADAGVDTIQTDRVSIEHRPALMGREAVAVDIDDVDIAGTLGNALFQDLGAFVDQRVHGALDDVFIGQRAALHALFLRGGFQNGRQLRVGQRGARTLLVDVEALAGLLTQHAGFGHLVEDGRQLVLGRQGLALTGTDGQADIQTGQVTHGEGAHGHAELAQGSINLLGGGTLFQQELGLAAVLEYHAVADETVAYANRYGDLLQFLADGHGGGQHFVAGLLAAHHFQQAHDVGRAEEVQTDYIFRTLGEPGNLVQVQRGGVAGQDGAGLAVGIQSLEDLLLDTHVLEDGFHHHIHVGQVGVVGDAADQRHALLQRRFGQAAALDAHAIGVTGALNGGIAGSFADFQDLDRNTGVGEAHGDAHAHGATADHGGGLDVAHRGIGRQTIDFGGLTLGEESMYQCSALRGDQTFGKQLALALETFGQRQGEGRLYGGYTALGREQTRGLLLDLGTLGGDQGSVVHAFQLVGALPGAARALAFGNQLLGEGQAGGQQVALEQLIDHTQLLGFGGGNGVAADDHVQRLLDTDHAGQTLGTAGAGQQAQLDFRQADLGVLAGDPVMAAQGHFQATAQGGAVDHGDARLAAGLDLVDHFRQAGRLRRFAELLDIGAGNEGVAFAHQYDGLDLRISLGGIETVLQSGAHGYAEGVDRRVVDSDNGNGTLPFQCDDLRHAEPPLILSNGFHCAK